jgi:hypothetical protein
VFAIKRLKISTVEDQLDDAQNKRCAFSFVMTSLDLIRASRAAVRGIITEGPAWMPGSNHGSCSCVCPSPAHEDQDALRSVDRMYSIAFGSRNAELFERMRLKAGSSLRGSGYAVRN